MSVSRIEQHPRVQHSRRARWFLWIFSLLMLRHHFVAPTVNLERIAPDCEGVRHVQAPLETRLRTVMTFNAGLGGSNACLIFRRP